MRLRCSFCNEELSKRSPTTIVDNSDEHQRRFCDHDCYKEYHERKRKLDRVILYQCLHPNGLGAK